MVVPTLGFLLILVALVVVVDTLVLEHLELPDKEMLVVTLMVPQQVVAVVLAPLVQMVLALKQVLVV